MVYQDYFIQRRYVSRNHFSEAYYFDGYDEEGKKTKLRVFKTFHKLVNETDNIDHIVRYLCARYNVSSEYIIYFLYNKFYLLDKIIKKLDSISVTTKINYAFFVNLEKSGKINELSKESMFIIANMYMYTYNGNGHIPHIKYFYLSNNQQLIQKITNTYSRHSYVIHYYNKLFEEDNIRLESNKELLMKIIKLSRSSPYFFNNLCIEKKNNSEYIWNIVKSIFKCNNYVDYVKELPVKTFKIFVNKINNKNFIDIEDEHRYIYQIEDYIRYKMEKTEHKNIFEKVSFENLLKKENIYKKRKLIYILGEIIDLLYNRSRDSEFIMKLLEMTNDILSRNMEYIKNNKIYIQNNKLFILKLIEGFYREYHFNYRSNKYLEKKKKELLFMLFTKYGFNINEKDDKGVSIFMMLLGYNADKDIVKFMVQNGAYINDYDNKGKALFTYCKNSSQFILIKDKLTRNITFDVDGNYNNNILITNDIVSVKTKTTHPINKNNFSLMI